MPRWMNNRRETVSVVIASVCEVVGDVVGGITHQSRFFANARPEWDLRYFSNSSALYLSGKAQYQTNSQGLNFAVCVDLPELWSDIRRFKSAVAPLYSCSGELTLRMM
jgi:hypothetical protein